MKATLCNPGYRPLTARIRSRPDLGAMGESDEDGTRAALQVSFGERLTTGGRQMVFAGADRVDPPGLELRSDHTDTDHVDEGQQSQPPQTTDDQMLALDGHRAASVFHAVAAVIHGSVVMAFGVHLGNWAMRFALAKIIRDFSQQMES